jgi:hypothetical protein
MQTVSHDERNTAVGKAAEAIGQSGGWITDHNLFSDRMAVLRFSLPADRTGLLGRTLSERGMVVEPEPEESMGASDEEVFGVLSISFPQRAGDLRRDVPAFDP